MPNHANPCNFTILANTPNGSKLAGNGFNGRPMLQNGDSINVVVHWAGNNPPGQLRGHFIFSPSAGAHPNQTTPSPFVNGSKFLCLDTQTKPAVNNSYAFDALTYRGSLPGSYELTFVAEDFSTSPPTQWSRDPEFETGN